MEELLWQLIARGFEDAYRLRMARLKATPQCWVLPADYAISDTSNAVDDAEDPEDVDDWDEVDESPKA